MSSESQLLLDEVKRLDAENRFLREENSRWAVRWDEWQEKTAPGSYDVRKAMRTITGEVSLHRLASFQDPRASQRALHEVAISMCDEILRTEDVLVRVPPQSLKAQFKLVFLAVKP